MEVEIKKVVKRFGSVTAVNSVSLDIKEGEFFSLLGPSGCGKSTLLRMLAGLEIPDSGTIFIHGQDVTYAPAYDRPTNLVFQNLALFPHMTVNKNIEFGLKMKKVYKAERQRMIAEALEMVSLPGMGDRHPSQLSGGQQQRVAIARALVNRPKVLLFDEPLGALDLKLRLQMQMELKSLQRKTGSTFIYVTHDQGEALTMSDRIAVMKDGCFYQVGTPSEIYSKPSNSFVAYFIGDTNLIEGELESQTADGEAGHSVVITKTGLRVKAGLATEEPRSRVFISLRQELIRMGDEADGMGNVFDAKIIGVVFLGPIIRYTLQIGDTVLSANGVYQKEYHVGDRVKIGWAKNDMMILSK